MESALRTLVWLIVVLAVVMGGGYAAKWIIDTFLPEPHRKLALALAGVVLLVILIILAARALGIRLNLG